MSNFQTIFIGIFIAGAVLAVLVFGGFINIGPKDEKVAKGKVTIWGTFSKSDISNTLESTSENTGVDITYIQVSKESYQESIINAFAKDKAPDLFIISPDMIIENDPFIYKIPYESLSEKLYRDTFVDGADIYLGTKGVVGFPLVVDPMVMYYNKNMFSNEGIVNTPLYWDELFNLNSRLTKKEDNGTIKESMIALGQYSNIKNAKDILATLFIQSGNSIIIRDEVGYRSILSENPLSLPENPSTSALNFFTEFSDPSLSSYSWNKSMPNSFDMFTSDKLAMYLGYSSEIFKIQDTNPNISFDVKMIPQARGVKNKRTVARIYALVVSKKSTNVAGAFSVASALSYGASASSFAEAVSLPPVTRALLSTKPKEAYLETFFNSAIIANSWLDPNENDTNLIFSQLVENVLSNKLGSTDSFTKAEDKLNRLIK